MSVCGGFRPCATIKGRTGNEVDPKRVGYGRVMYCGARGKDSPCDVEMDQRFKQASENKPDVYLLLPQHTNNTHSTV